MPIVASLARLTLLEAVRNRVLWLAVVVIVVMLSHRRGAIVMILLGVVTGAPTASSYVIEELEKIPRETEASMEEFLIALEKNEELLRQPDWKRLNDFLKAHISKRDTTNLLAALVDVRSQVSRYSFRVGRTEPLGQKTKSVVHKKTAATRKKAAGA